MNKLAAILVSIGLVSGAIYFFYSLANTPPILKDSTPPPVPTGTHVSASVFVPTPSPSINQVHYPIPTNNSPGSSSGSATAKTTSRISLDESDPVIYVALSELVDNFQLQNVFITKDFIRRAVVSIDNCARRQIPTQSMPFKKVTGSFQFEKSAGTFLISSKNYVRYHTYLEILKKVDTERLVDFYFRYYPLFEKAYGDLGVGEHFNDRLIEVIDVIMDTPELSQSIPLIQPAVYFKYADQKLEKLPACQKTLIRMGTKNARAVKEILTQIRKRIVHG